MKNTLSETILGHNIVLSITYVAQLVFLFCAYFFTGKLGLALDPVSGFASLFWLPAGIALAAILTGGYRLWPAVFLGAFLVNITQGAPLFSAIGIALGNTLEAVIAVYLLNRYVHFRASLERTHDIVGLIIFVAPASALVSATIGVISLDLGNVITNVDLFPTWITWMFGNIISNALIAPFLLIWGTYFSFPQLNLKKIIEGTLAITLLLLSCLLIFITSSFSYMLFPPLIWIALRFSQRTTITAVITVACLAIIALSHGYGPFVKNNLRESLFYMQSFIGVIGLTALILSVNENEQKQLKKRKDEFISIASHELKIPITSMTIFLQLLERLSKKKGNEQALDLIQKTNKQMQKMTLLISDLLDVSKIQIGKLELKKEKIIINDLVHDVTENMQRILTNHMIVIDGQSNKKIYADRERVSQVLTNLINNAAKYSPSAYKILVKIRTTKQTVIVQVTDFGIGIAEKDQQKIFERFFRVEGSDEKTYPGFGIGLYIAREIIKLHNGMLWVDSIEGYGSTFSFSLPLTKKIR